MGSKYSDYKKFIAKLKTLLSSLSNRRTCMLYLNVIPDTWILTNDVHFVYGVMRKGSVTYHKIFHKDKDFLETFYRVFKIPTDIPVFIGTDRLMRAIKDIKSFDEIETSHGTNTASKRSLGIVGKGGFGSRYVEKAEVNILRGHGKTLDKFVERDPSTIDAFYSYEMNLSSENKKSNTIFVRIILENIKKHDSTNFFDDTYSDVISMPLICGLDTVSWKEYMGRCEGQMVLHHVVRNGFNAITTFAQYISDDLEILSFRPYFDIPPILRRKIDVRLEPNRN